MWDPLGRWEEELPWVSGCALFTLPSSLRMSMRSPGSAQLALDGGGTMVNCAVKSEGKQEPCHEAPQGSAATADPQPGDPARATQDGADPRALAQVPSAFPGAPGSVSPLHPCTTPPPPPAPQLDGGAGRNGHLWGKT